MTPPARSPRRARLGAGAYDLPHELVAAEILPRLPVKPLLQFRCVCKAWRDAVDDGDSFRRAHLRRGRENPPCLLIFPRVVGESSGFYRWEESRKDEATLAVEHTMPAGHRRRIFINPLREVEHDLAHPMPYGHRAFTLTVPLREVEHDLAHCDGLVLAPTDSAAHLLNPATRRAVALPASPRPPHVPAPRKKGHQTFGLGRDPRSGVYKVARFSHRSSEKLSAAAPSNYRYTFGMEVLTVPTAGQQWRETQTPPPYPAMPGRMATFFKGSLFWTIDESLLPLKLGGTPVSPGFMRFRLDDESFGITPLPPRIGYPASSLAELSGELCVCSPRSGPGLKEAYELWICHDPDDEAPRWELRHVINWLVGDLGTRALRPLAVYDDAIVLYDDVLSHLCSCDRRTHRTRCELYADVAGLKYHHLDTGTLVDYQKTAHGFNITPYIPSLVPV